MFCPNCGNHLDKNDNFCSKCKTDIKKFKNQYSNITTKNKTDYINQSHENILEKKLKSNKMKEFYYKYKKYILIFLLGVFIIIIGVLLYSCLVGFEKLSWDESYLSTKTKLITQTKLKLGVKFSNKDKINNIKWKTNCGKIDGKGLEISWDLSNVVDTCEISASYKLKKIKRNIKVIPFDVEENDLSLKYSIDDDSDEDLDYDGLTNKQEKEYNTNPLIADTDLDGLDDKYEIFVSKTDPNKKDSDNDGLNDYDEIQLGLNPLKADSKNDGLSDGQRELTYNYESDNVKIAITGKGNIASTTSKINSDTKISGKKGLINNLYTLYTDGTITQAILTIKYTGEELKKYEIDEDNLSIYYYDENESKYKKINSTVDKKNKTVTAKLNHFSNYILGDSSLVKEKVTNQVLFILDNSWSMYTNEQYKKYTGKEYTGGLISGSKLEGSDADGKRFSLTSKLVNKLASKNYQVGLSEFRKDYVNALSIGSSSDSIRNKLSNMIGNFITSDEGTNIANALTSGLDEFSKESDNKYIVILTDGQDSSLSRKTKNIIEKATDKNIKICSIGFGGSLNNAELANISNSTGCKFYISSNAMGLSELFQNMEINLEDDLVDIDDDNKVDGVLIADSGFIVNRDGFSFKNYSSNLAGGHCYGMAVFAQLYYKKVLPLNLNSKTVDKYTSYAYNLSNNYFKKYGSLYNYKFKTNALKYEFGFENFGEENPADFRYLKGTALLLNNKYKKDMNATRIYDIAEEESRLDSKAQLKKNGVNYETIENFYLNEDKIQKSYLMNKTDLQLLNAIYAAFIKQFATTHYTSSFNFMLWLRNTFGTESTGYSGAEGFINILKTRLNDKDAPAISANYSNGLHAVNAISLVQDIDNPNKYYIGVYDNNYPGEKRYVNLECNKDICVTKANKYYTNSNEPIRISPALEYDLVYYK